MHDFNEVARQLKCFMFLYLDNLSPYHLLYSSDSVALIPWFTDLIPFMKMKFDKASEILFMFDITFDMSGIRHMRPLVTHESTNTEI